MVVPTAREPDGLALSSRNTYLNPEQRGPQLGALPRPPGRLESVPRRRAQRGSPEADHGEDNQAEPLARMQYVSCADRVSLEELDQITDGALLSMAVYVGKTRLIDNWILE